MLFPPVPSNNGHYNGVLEILQNIEKILQCKVHNIPPNHMQQACLVGAERMELGGTRRKAQGNCEMGRDGDGKRKWLSVRGQLSVAKDA